MSHHTFLLDRLTLVSNQLAELSALASSFLSPLGQQCLALRQAALAQELALLAPFAAQESSSAPAHNTREVAA